MIPETGILGMMLGATLGVRLVLGLLTLMSLWGWTSSFTKVIWYKRTRRQVSQGCTLFNDAADLSEGLQAVSRDGTAQKHRQGREKIASAIPATGPGGLVEPVAKRCCELGLELAEAPLATWHGGIRCRGNRGGDWEEHDVSACGFCVLVPQPAKLSALQALASGLSRR